MDLHNKIMFENNQINRQNAFGFFWRWGADHRLGTAKDLGEDNVRINIAVGYRLNGDNRQPHGPEGDKAMRQQSAEGFHSWRERSISAEKWGEEEDSQTFAGF